MADAPTCNALASPAKDAGNSSFAAGRYQEAYDYYSQAIQADPDSALLRSNRSGALAALGRHVEALADADKCCQLRPDWYKSHVRRGHAMFQLNRVTDAEAILQNLVHVCQRCSTPDGKARYIICILCQNECGDNPVPCPGCGQEMELQTLSSAGESSVPSIPGSSGQGSLGLSSAEGATQKGDGDAVQQSESSTFDNDGGSGSNEHTLSLPPR
eukprot:symbB.v1.2.035563.t1/scaffold4822.1/size34315/1